MRFNTRQSRTFSHPPPFVPVVLSAHSIVNLDIVMSENAGHDPEQGVNNSVPLGGLRADSYPIGY